jgi:aminoglycoside phosphotransferase (APT) family kinase protein
MHDDELDLGEALVRSLLADQFPEWGALPLQRIEPSGTDNAIFRLDDELAVRLPRRRGPTEPGSKELEWLPRLAPLLPVEIPVPVAQGRPADGYPWFWEIHTWVDGATVPVADIDPIQAARDLAALVSALRRIDPAPRPVAAFHWPSSTRTSATGWSGSAATRGSCRPGSGRSPRRRGTAHPCGTTATWTPATGWFATAASPA